jgi:hypothetical protein
MTDSRKGFTQIRQHATSVNNGEAVKGTILSSDLELANQYMKALAVVPDGWKLIEVGFTPANVAAAGVKCLDALKSSYWADPHTIVVAVFQDMLLAYSSLPPEQEPTQ